MNNLEIVDLPVMEELKQDNLNDIHGGVITGLILSYDLGFIIPYDLGGLGSGELGFGFGDEIDLFELFNPA